MNKNSLNEAAKYLKRTLALSKAINVFGIIEKTMLVAAAVITLGELATVIRKMKG